MYLENVTVIIVDLVEYAPRQVCGIRFLHLLNAPATLFSQEHQKNKEKVSWRAGKTTITFDLVKNKLNSGYSKIEFRVAGANQDATSTRRCDLSQDPSTNNAKHPQIQRHPLPISERWGKVFK